MNKIDTKEILAVTFFTCTALYPGFGINSVLNTGNTTSLIALIVAFIIGIIPLFAIIYLNKKMKDKNIFEYNKEKFKIFGTIINIILVLIGIYILFINSWTFCNFVISQFLTRNSYYVLAIVYFLIVSYLVTKNINVICKTSTVLLIFFFLIIIPVFGILFTKIDITNVKPLFTISASSFIGTVIKILAFTSTPIIALLAIRPSNLDDQKKFKKFVIIGYALAGIILFIYTFLIITTYGIEFSKILDYPGYSLYKQVKALNFIDRIENFIVIVFFDSTFINLTMATFFISEFINTVFKIKEEKKKTIITYIFPLVISLTSIYVFKHFYTYKVLSIFPIISTIAIIIIIILALLSKIKKDSKDTIS